MWPDNGPATRVLLCKVCFSWSERLIEIICYRCRNKTWANKTIERVQENTGNKGWSYSVREFSFSAWRVMYMILRGLAFLDIVNEARIGLWKWCPMNICPSFSASSVLFFYVLCFVLEFRKKNHVYSLIHSIFILLKKQPRCERDVESKHREQS